MNKATAKEHMLLATMAGQTSSTTRAPCPWAPHWKLGREVPTAVSRPLS